ncbi:MAG: imidazole glycerol phosphate synthase subunit HisH [Candidatus Bathyarchaeia archaeon]
MLKVTIIDCGIGNLFSIECALKKIGLDAKISSTAKGLQNVDAIVLPGVGNFRAGSDNLRLLKPEIVKIVEDGVPLFGICLGMQLLFEESEESPGRGLGIFSGKVVKLPKHIKSPHMGWNTLKITKPTVLLDGIDEKDHFYFVHSYYPNPAVANVVAAVTDYSITFASVVAKKNVFGVQFHPEKSGKPGERVLRNFVRIVKK